MNALIFGLLSIFPLIAGARAQLHFSVNAYYNVINGYGHTSISELNTKISVSAGYMINFTASGSWYGGSYWVGPTGSSTDYKNGNYSFPQWSLVGRVGNNGYFYIGNSLVYTVPAGQSGNISLAFWDMSYYDNTGAIAVTLSPIEKDCSNYRPSIFAPCYLNSTANINVQVFPYANQIAIGCKITNKPFSLSNYNASIIMSGDSNVAYRDYNQNSTCASNLIFSPIQYGQNYTWDIRVLIYALSSCKVKPYENNDYISYTVWSAFILSDVASGKRLSAATWKTVYSYRRLSNGVLDSVGYEVNPLNSTNPDPVTLAIMLIPFEDRSLSKVYSRSYYKADSTIYVAARFKENEVRNVIEASSYANFLDINRSIVTTKPITVFSPSNVSYVYFSFVVPKEYSVISLEITFKIGLVSTLGQSLSVSNYISQIKVQNEEKTEMGEIKPFYIQPNDINSGTANNPIMETISTLLFASIILITLIF